MKKILTLIPLVLFISGCDYLDLNGEQEAQKGLKNANAIGAGCKQAGKSLEICYSENTKANKAAVYDGWKSMDEYMRENNMKVQGPDDAPTPTKPEVNHEVKEPLKADSKPEVGEKPKLVPPKNEAKDVSKLEPTDKPKTEATEPSKAK